VLDPVGQARGSLPELELLSLFARQAATALRFAVQPAGAAADQDAGLPVRHRAEAARLLRELEKLLG